MKRNLYLLILAGLLMPGRSLAQGITTRDSEEIKLLAQRKVERGLSDFLNVLVDEDLEEAQRKEIVRKSLALDTPNRLFYNQDVIIEDDLQPERPIDQPLDLKIEKYLANLDLFYTKSSEPTIAFSNVKVSSVKERGYTYVKVFYTQLFKGKNNQSAVAFRPVPRVAEMRAERVGKKWTVMIAQIGFLAPGDSVTAALNNVTLVEPPAPVDSAAIAAEKERAELEQARLDEERRKEEKLRETYKNYITEGDKALANKDYAGALRSYGEAEKFNKSQQYEDEIPSIKISKVNRLMNAAKIAERELLRENAEKAELARKKRQYNEALQYYNKIQAKFPDSTALLVVIKDLTRKANIKTEFDEQFASGQYEKLVSDYDKIIKKEEANSDWYLGRAKCYLKLNKDDRAMKDLNKSIELDYANLDALLARADLNRKLGNLPKAIADQTAYLNIDTKNDNIYAQRGQLRVRTNNLAAADEDFTQAITLNPNQGAYYYDRGLLRNRNQQYDAAVADFTKTIELTPAKPDAYFWRGMIYAMQKQYPLCGADFADAVKKKAPVDYSARMDSVVFSLYSLGQQANQAKNYEQAVLHLTDAIAVRSASPQALYERGFAYFNQQAYEEAIDDLTASIKYAPTDGPPFDKRAEAYMATGKYDLAVADYRQSVTINPANYPAMLGQATALVQLKKYVDAIPSLIAVKSAQKKIEKNYTPTFFRDMYYRLGQCEAATNQYDKAVDDYSSALKLDENFVTGYLDRGAAYEALGRLDRAVDDYQRAIERNPTSVPYYFAKASALEKKGDYAEAITAYGEVARLDSTQQWQTKTLLRRGASYIGIGQYTEALTDLKQDALQADTLVCRHDCWLNTGLAYLYAGQPDAGLPYLARCQGTQPYAARAAYATACAYLQRNDETGALTWFERAFQDKVLTSADIRKDKLIDLARKDFRKNKAFRQLTDKYLK
ncbi:tetratricopeptide repeat protein [Fibrisoma limi]|nr:tetratricopeptide repeat protein [Fibrisoma limi]